MLGCVANKRKWPEIQVVNLTMQGQHVVKDTTQTVNHSAARGHTSRALTWLIRRTGVATLHPSRAEHHSLTHPPEQRPQTPRLKGRLKKEGWEGVGWGEGGGGEGSEGCGKAWGQEDVGMLCVHGLNTSHMPQASGVTV